MTSIPVPAPEAPLAEPSGTRIGPVVIAFAIGTAVSIGLGVYGRLHTPTGHAVNIAGFSTGAAAKAFLASIAMALAIVQIVTALGIYGRIPLAWRLGRSRPSLVRTTRGPHLGSGGGALSLRTGLRGLRRPGIAHSLFGCFLYGAFVFKMLILTRDDSPAWALPLAGGLVLSGTDGPLDDGGVVLPRYMITRSFPTRRSRHETIRPTDRRAADLSAYGDHERRTGGRGHRWSQLLHQLFNHPGQRAICCCASGGGSGGAAGPLTVKETDIPSAAARSFPMPRR